MRKVAVATALVAVAATAFAQQDGAIDLAGHSWETGGFPPSQLGDELQMVGIVHEIQGLPWDPANNSYTWYSRELSSLGELMVGSLRVVTYDGGLFTIYVDGLPSNHDYGVNPPNATSPSTFTDGTSTYLDGFYSAFELTYDDGPPAQGSFTGTLTFTGGDAFGNLSATSGWMFGANLGGVSPTGYDLQINGDVALQAVAVQQKSWGGVKTLYR